MNSISKTVFFSGCGGGYDIFGCLPYYFKMRSLNINDITLINFSFTKRAILSAYGQQLTTLLFRIDAITNASWLTDDIYFPEQRLANELQTPIYAIICHYNETRIELIVEAYNYLIQGRIIDELILFDCGSDVLLTGTEEELGTPIEDIAHARAVHLLSSEQIKAKYIVVIGTNIDVGHGVLQTDIDARLNALAPSAKVTWLWAYKNDDNVRRYVDIVFRCNPQHTIVHSLVCAALQGKSGYYLPKHLRARIHKSLVSLGEHTCLSTGYPFDVVMRDNIYFEQLLPGMNLQEVATVIDNVQNNLLSNVGNTSSKKTTS